MVELLRGLHAGDLETILLAVEMAADQNLLPCPGPEEERILAFLRRLVAFDAVLPSDPDGPSANRLTLPVRTRADRGWA